MTDELNEREERARALLKPPTEPAAGEGRVRRVRRPRAPREPREKQPTDLSYLKWIAIAAAAVLVLAGGGTAIAIKMGPMPVPEAVVQPVSSSLAVCPEPGIAETELDTLITAAVVPNLPGQDGPKGTATIETLPGKPAASSSIEKSGGQTSIDVTNTDSPPIVGVATGSLAPGFTADQRGRDTKADGRGMTSVACGPTLSQFWFVGGGAALGQRSRIVLVNPEEFPAQVDVDVYSPVGLVDTEAGRGVIVPARERVVLRLDAIAPRIKFAAVHVVARSGRVAAAMHDEIMTGLRSEGADWVPVSAAPANRVVMPGLSSGKGERQLSILAPGKDDGTVTVRVITQDGNFVPAGVEKLQLVPGEVKTLDIASVVERQSATLELTSDVPIVAGVREIFGANAKNGELIYTTGSTPWTGSAAVTGLPSSDADAVRLSITAPDGDANASVTLMGFSNGGKSMAPEKPTEVKVPAGQLRDIKLDPPAGSDWFTAIVSSEGAPVVVAHRIVEKSSYGDLVTGYPWSPLRVSVTSPAVQQNGGAALPGEPR